jgi:uncharacterized damage-inducible protein DinB
MPAQSKYLASALEEFQSNRKIVRHILETLPETDLHATAGAVNSIAILVQHLRGAHFRRWTNLFSANPPAGEARDFSKDWSDRALSREELLALHDEGWDLVIRTLNGLSDADLDKPVPLRGKEVALLQAIIYHWSHYSYHVGQIVLLAKIATQGKWNVATAKGNPQTNPQTKAGEKASDKSVDRKAEPVAA